MSRRPTVFPRTIMAEPKSTLDLNGILFDLSSLTAPLSWTEIFGNPHPIEFEVGPGKGLFLANAASTRPETNFFGVELSRKYARKAAERVAKKGLTNVRVVSGDARRALSQYAPPSSLNAVHVYFPDPWWKKRHKKRRVFTESFVLDARRALRPGGALHLATDVEEYFEVMTGLMSTHPEWEPLALPEPGTPEHDLDYLTNFERKYRLEGRPIYRASYRLQPSWIEPRPDSSM